MKTLLKLLGLLLLLVLAALLFIYSGVYDMAASNPDAGLIAWVLQTTQERSVHRAYESLEGKVQIPKLDDPQRIQTGFVHYHEMCVTCHAAPGVEVSEIGMGLNPFPPELAKGGGDEPLETFWIVKNGIKMTGMPSFGATHTDDEIWAIVAFLNRLPKLSSQEYQAMVQQAGLGQPGEEPGETAGQAQPTEQHHTSPPGTPPHKD
ncbi:MAG TPA: cytochrome c [Thermoanaerobaculia bacterium]|jgi:mono/diheme cytochrome c family protein|nr:cytochrome c [Thermoanaerobaculia bacterium]